MRYIKIALVALVIVLAVSFSSFISTVDSNLHGFPEEQQTALDEQVSPSGAWGLSEVNVLLLGSDARADNPDLGARTDTIVLAHIDPTAKVASLISIPRDTLIESDDYGWYKLNAAYTYGGPARTVDDVELLLGIQIDHCVVTNFEGLSNLVDAIGGIDVEVDEMIDNPKAGDVIVPAGEQTINGAQALVMARDRDYVDGDYTRQSNQRKVLSGIARKILSMPPWQMPGAIEGCSKCLDTDSSTGTMGLLLTAARMKLPGSQMEMRTTVLPSRPAEIDGISYVVADKAGSRELLSRFYNGENIEDPVSDSSIDRDIAQLDK